MRLLILGGTQFVGRAIADAARARGDDVVLLNRGTKPAPANTATIQVDRRDQAALLAALRAHGPWDAVIDTWSGEPAVVAGSVAALRDSAASYAYVSSRSVHQWPIPSGADENAPLVDADPTSGDATDYPAAKRGGELAVLEGFDRAALILRPGLILGPHEHPGRLPWWLRRCARGGLVPAPGPVDRPLQYLDARDLAEWLLALLDDGRTGIVNAVSPPGHATIGALLSACVEVTGGRAELRWLSPEQIEEAGVSGWTDLPIWVPPSGPLASLHDGDATKAEAWGLVCRPIEETVHDTWQSLTGELAPDPQRPVGLSSAQESRLLAAADLSRAEPES